MAHFSTRTIKLKNKRIILGRCEEDGSFLLRAKRLLDTESVMQGFYSESVIEGRKVTTSIILSKEGCVALYLLLGKELNIEDILEFEKSSGQKIINEEKQ